MGSRVFLSTRKLHITLPSFRRNSSIEDGLIRSDITNEMIGSVDYTTMPRLQYGLDRVLFKNGVHLTRESFSDVPILQKMTHPDDFNYDAIPAFQPPSQDDSLRSLCTKHSKKVFGSTSSTTGALSQLYFLISGFSRLNSDAFPEEFRTKQKGFTTFAKLPASIILRPHDGDVYSIDADKSLEYQSENIMSKQGIIMEYMFTTAPDQYQLLLKENAHLAHNVKLPPSSFRTVSYGDLLIRSQLDCYHPELKRNVFDIKTRATVAIRMDAEQYHYYKNYHLHQMNGDYNSFTREYYDMARSAFLKYNFQVRIGQMDGLFVAYHNTEEIFGFSYLKRENLDRVLFGSPEMGDRVFNLCVQLLSRCVSKAINTWPGSAMRLSFVGREKSNNLTVYVERIRNEKNATSFELPEDIPRMDIEKWVIRANKKLNGVMMLQDDFQTTKLSRNDVMELEFEIEKMQYSGLPTEYLRFRKAQFNVRNRSPEAKLATTAYFLRFFSRYFVNDNNKGMIV